MATFYVLPSRHLLGQRFAGMLTSLFPGLRHAACDWPELAEMLSAMIEERSDALIIFREDLHEQSSTREELIRDFGAELHDAVVEISCGTGLTEVLQSCGTTEELRRSA
jgi:hypothetical protein